ncbi:MAG: hypothetical protein U0003_04715 [Vampirovibrionales bacterium]
MHSVPSTRFGAVLVPMQRCWQNRLLAAAYEGRYTGLNHYGPLRLFVQPESAIKDVADLGWSLQEDLKNSENPFIRGLLKQFTSVFKNNDLIVYNPEAANDQTVLDAIKNAGFVGATILSREAFPILHNRMNTTYQAGANQRLYSSALYCANGTETQKPIKRPGLWGLIQAVFSH